MNAAHREPWRGERVDVLGVAVSAIDIGDAIACIEHWIAERTPHYICITGVHGVMESGSDTNLRTIHNQAGLVTPDGMPLVWIGHRCGATRMQRVYGPDLMRAVIARSPARGYRHFFYGGAEGVAAQLAKALTEKHPGLVVAGTLCPPFRPLTKEEDAAVVAEINAARPDVIWIGLSTPKQEYWMAQHIRRVDAPVLVGVGAAFDFLAGTKQQAPAWMQRRGLEWLFRLVTEPRRLWRRYLQIVPGFMVRLLIAQLGKGKPRLMPPGASS